jgi:hypothetical protein
MIRWDMAAVTLGIIAAQALPCALAQAQDQPFVARADINVQNDSPVPQTVAGTNVAPFELQPHQQAALHMSVTPPPAPTAPGSSVPVRFEYSVGQSAGPQCHGTIDMSLNATGSFFQHYDRTNCVAHALASDGANCNIAVSAKDSVCQGGLSFASQ